MTPIDIQARVPTDAFAPSYIALCVASYASPVSTIPAQVAKVPPLDPGGSWQCVWGPAEDPDKGNLVYVAAYYAANGQPVFTVTVTRGTDDQTVLGLLKEIWEDLDAGKQVAWPYPNGNNPGNARIASGTNDGLQNLVALRSGGQTIAEFLAAFTSDPKNLKPLVVVTGHSLGGCLTTVLAPYLQYALAKAGVQIPIVPVSFAAPTAGNGAFIQMYQASFSYCPRWYNVLDVIPFGFADLGGISGIYSPYGLSCPGDIEVLVDGYAEILRIAGVSYSQQTACNAPLQGDFAPNLSWLDEMGQQHHSTTYASLIGSFPTK